MKQQPSRTRRSVAFAGLCLFALSASLLAVTPTSAKEIGSSGAPARADKLPTFSACVSPASDSSSFEDIEGLEAEDAINCLAYYKVTVGKTPDMFDPDTVITRSQLALMLYRSAKLVGITLKGNDADQYADLENVEEERREAVGVLTHNKIMEADTRYTNGASAPLMFAVNEPATRLEIVAGMVRLLRLADTDLFNRNGTLKLADTKIDYFADSRSDLPRGHDDLVSIAYELGLTTGSRNDRYSFNADDTVPRKHLAAFLTRMLSHTNLRPEGLTAQADGRTIVASIRDDNFKPVDKRPVDGFYVLTNDEGKGFTRQGECTSVVKAVVTGTSKCRIASLDPLTNGDGNVNLNLADTDGVDVTAWVWTDRVGTVFDSDATAYKLRLEGLPVSATSTKVTPDQEGTFKPAFGEDKEFTVQLRGQVAGSEVNATVGVDGKNPAKYTFSQATHVGAHTSVAAAKAAAVFSKDADITLATDDTGELSFSVTASDPDTTSVGQSRTVVWSLTPKENAPSGVIEQYVIFSDSESVVSHVKAEADNPFVPIASTGSTGSQVITVSVLDQHGVGMRNQGVKLVSSLNTANNNRSTMVGTRYTGSDGKVRIGYTHKFTEPVEEIITASLATGTNAISGSVTVYWALVTPDATRTEANKARVLSAKPGQIVVDTDTGGIDPAPHLVVYDDNDVFQIGDAYATYANFVKEITKNLEDKKAFYLHWDSYSPNDRDDIAAWFLTTPAS